MRRKETPAPPTETAADFPGILDYFSYPCRYLTHRAAYSESMKTISMQLAPARQEPVGAEEFIGFLAARFETEREIFDIDAPVIDVLRNILAARGQEDTETRIGRLSRFVLLEVCLNLEERFGVTIRDGEAYRFYRTGSLLDLLALVNDRRARPIVYWNDILRFLEREVYDVCLDAELGPDPDFPAVFALFARFQFDGHPSVSDVFWPVFERYEIDIDAGEIPGIDRIASRADLLSFVNGKIAAKRADDCRSRHGARWSTEARMRTRDMLRHPADSRWGYLAGGGMLRHLAGDRAVLLPDFSPESGYRIVDAEWTAARTYRSIEELLEDGWIVDEEGVDNRYAVVSGRVSRGNAA